MLMLPQSLTALALGRTSEVTFSHFFLWEHLRVRRSVCKPVYKPVLTTQVLLCSCSHSKGGLSRCLSVSLSRQFVHVSSWCPALLFLRVIFSLDVACCWLGSLQCEHLDLSVEHFAKLFILLVFSLALLPGEIRDKAYLLVAACPGQLRSWAGVKAAVSEQRAWLVLILNSQWAGSFSSDGVAPSFSLSVTARLFYCAHNALMGDITQLQQVQLQKQVAAICSLNAAI